MRIIIRVLVNAGFKLSNVFFPDDEKSVVFLSNSAFLTTKHM